MTDTSRQELPTPYAMKLFQMAKRTTILSGWYHDNAFVSDGGAHYIVRSRRRLGGFDPEPRQFDEASVLDALGGIGPKVRFRSARPTFIILDYISGVPAAEAKFEMDDLHLAVVQLWQSLMGVERQQLVMLPRGRRFTPKRYRSSAGFHEVLVEWLKYIYQRSGWRTREILSLFGIEENPFNQFAHMPIARRDLRLCHGDFNPSNCIIDGISFHPIDWELALWGDPAWDVACYLHRFSLGSAESINIMDKYRVALGMHDEGWATFARDVLAYRELEEVRSLVIDTSRIVEARRAIDVKEIESFVAKMARLTYREIDEGAVRSILRLSL